MFESHLQQKVGGKPKIVETSLMLYIIDYFRDSSDKD